ncbi:hypothetical protein G6M12_24185 [Agrobacterium tumefaciens]|uniref:hypothetical protein n=1 Tax=Agrobacterium TaxID=357 RepID=UPI00131A1F69|nr:MULTISPECIES: hypothetical protein [Agrobacterium]NSY99008.1 hypothetical protein [Agrobacterium tumefaciens]NTE84660.1 hypothetical protein [Agrobacterium tumefaciens]
MENLHVRSVAGNAQGQPYEYLKVVFEAGLIIVLGHQTETRLSQKLISFRQTIAQDKVKKIHRPQNGCVYSVAGLKVDIAGALIS